MYAEDYDYDLPPPSRYSTRDYYFDDHRERDRDRLYRGSGGFAPPSLDDPYYSRPRSDPLLPAPSRHKEPLLGPKYSDSEAGAYIQGSVIILPPPPYETKPKVSAKPANCNTVFVGSIPDNTNDNNLYDLFSKCGSIKDIRIAIDRNFAHVEFTSGSSVDSAVELNGYVIRVGPTHSPADKSRIHVDYAQSRERSLAKRKASSGESLVYSAGNASTINSELRSEEGFEFAATNLMDWMEKGSCTATTSSSFFGMLSTVNLVSHRLNKDVKATDEELEEFLAAQDKKFCDFLHQCDVIESVFSAAMQKRAWDQFTKPQRKSITQWKDLVQDVRDGIKKKQQRSASAGDGEESQSPVAKKAKHDEDTSVKADLERAEREIEQLRVDHEVTLEKRERQILQLKTLLAKFKQSCPREWEKIVGGDGKGAGKGAKLPFAVKTEEEDDSGEGEVIDGVSLNDLNRTLEGGGSDKSLAAAAAAYAQVRAQMGTMSDEAGLGVSEMEVALSAVMAAFLTVHPLGASMSEISTYFQTFNPTYNSYYLESLLRRMPQVFQLSQAANGEPRWWFLGFQTISVTVSSTDMAIGKEKPSTAKKS